MTKNTNLDSLLDSLTEEELNEPLPYSFQRDYSMIDLQEPANLWVVLKEHFGDNFEGASQEQKITLISLVSFALVEGGSFLDACRAWVDIENLLPIEVIVSEVERSKGVELLRALTASLSDELL